MLTKSYIRAAHRRSVSHASAIFAGALLLVSALFSCHSPYLPLRTADEGQTTWNYTVTFDAIGANLPSAAYSAAVASDPAVMTVASPSTTIAALPATPPTLAGYVFGGWVAQIGGTWTDFDETTAVPGNLTVRASWIKSRNHYRSFGLSGDGKIVLAGYESPLNVSTNGGLTWAARSADSMGTNISAVRWGSFASSRTGDYLFAGDASFPSTARMWRSLDRGATWTLVPGAAPRGGIYWTGIACSDTGRYVLRAAGEDESGGFWRSSDYGATWTEVSRMQDVGDDDTATNRVDTPFWGDYLAVAVSPSGQYQVAARSATGGGVTDRVFFSSDYGATWENVLWNTGGGIPSISISSDGTRIALASSKFMGVQEVALGTLSAGTWSWDINTTLNGSGWSGISASSDGSVIAACNESGYLYVSSDGGATWTERQPAAGQSWEGVRVSADGTTMIAAPWPGYLYVSTDAGVTWKPRF